MRIWLATVVLVAAAWAGASAQDLEPRAYSPSPIGTTFVVVGAGRSSGSVLTDPTLPVKDVNASFGGLTLGVGRTFRLAGRQAIVLGALPITWFEASGEVGENLRTINRRGLADPRIKLSMIFAGSPAMNLAEFARAPRRTILGASVVVVPPLGQYNREHLINLGSNRWSLKPEVGVSYPAGRWTIDGYAGVWLFTTNDAFYTGSSTRSQEPIAGLQGHVSYTIRRRAWVAFDATWYSGGRTNIDGVAKGDLQRNSRVGATLALPLTPRQSLKFSYSAGATTRIGGDYRSVGVAWQLITF